ncbi:MAG: 5-formyltetrahydrofolate cyclo-ligase [Rhodospirillum sp.]|nr:5-formyltetrahydrofolate cyclo-ligase [Rhodospirillum sp.]MCF8488028.1 5-formyltetrahydrofolate cyclo-ligase [Rhodospirillum sp.]MCF8500295.1 5-formyltetrahydrofolate cyclo-ligase [Rhodospirillum sp.]
MSGTDHPHPRDLAAAKADLRRDLRDRRRVASATLGPAAGEALAALVLAEVFPPESAVVGAYWPMPGEIDVRPLLEALAERRVALALPVVAEREGPLIFRRWSPGDPLEPGPLKTVHPIPTMPEVRPDWLLVPLMGFDRRGFRLGMGGGFYDRTLAVLASEGRSPFTLGVAFSAQEVDELPVEGHDYPLHAVATETGVRHFSPSTARAPRSEDLC